MSEFLGCDAPGCDHRESVETITEDMIGKPCPKCGASLLTAEDFAYWRETFKPSLDALLAAGVVKSAPENSDGAMSINYHHGEFRVKFRA